MIYSISFLNGSAEGYHIACFHLFARLDIYPTTLLIVIGNECAPFVIFGVVNGTLLVRRFCFEGNRNVHIIANSTLQFGFSGKELQILSVYHPLIHYITIIGFCLKGNIAILR